jgi:CheR methyltransferase, SAM binding domain
MERLQTARVALVFAAVITGQPVGKRIVTLQDLPPMLRPQFPAFDAFRAAVERSTATRLKEGEQDHLIFYLLQSRRFTREPRIEPAVSAKAFQETGQIPAGVIQRASDFLSAPAGQDERLDYLRSSTQLTREEILLEYERVMRSLYKKEFPAEKSDPAGWYRARGHSSDTQIEANYAVWSALRVLQSIHPAWRVRHALIVGPGLDFAPRTDLLDDAPQSYQPYALADALLGLKLPASPDWSIHAVDINPRVVSFLNAGRSRTLRLHTKPGDEGYTEYFLQLGRAIGERRGNAVAVRTEISGLISASLLNIITERITQSKFDLIVVTNVLLYFNSSELALALCNIDAMLEPGGFLITNDLNPQIDGYAEALGMKPVQARTIRIADSLFDSFAIYVR